MPESSRVTVGIVTRNRPESLRRCLSSLTVLGERLGEVIVVDDNGDLPVADIVSEVRAPSVRFVRQTAREGYIVARNLIVREASNDAVLLMDDDAALLPDGGFEEALGVFEAHPRIGSVACAMAEIDGSAWHASMQPAPVDYTCYVTAYIGFAHLVRRSVFLALGGYRESFHFYGEEKDLCLRMLQAGYDVVYTPKARVIHAVDPSGRDRSRYLRYVIRNDCLFALYNEPWPMACASVPVRLMRYFSMSRGLDHRIGDFRWIVGDLVRQLATVLAQRQAVSWATMRRWRRLARTWPAFPSDAAPSVTLGRRLA